MAHRSDIHRAANRKGERGKRQPYTWMLLAIQATAAHWVRPSWAVSWGSAMPRPKSSGCKHAHAIWTVNCPWPGQCPEGAEELGNAMRSFVPNNNPGKLQGHSLFSKSCPNQGFARAGILLWVAQNPTLLFFKGMRTPRPVSLEKKCP